MFYSHAYITLVPQLWQAQFGVPLTVGSGLVCVCACVCMCTCACVCLVMGCNVRVGSSFVS